jgi:hypothetical protein
MDHTQDLSGTDTHRLTTLYPPPEFVKAAAHERLYGNPEVLPPQVYGDPTTRTFPCHSAPATWMSALFFFNKRAELDDTLAKQIESRIAEAARYFKIQPDVEQLKTKVAADLHRDLSQLPDEDFALIWQDDQGNKERNYPIRNGDEVKVAAEWFNQYRDDFVFSDRHRIAGKIMEKAAAHRVVLPNAEMVNQTAGFGYCSAADIAGMLEVRANLVAREHPDYATEIRALAALTKEHGGDVRDHGFRIRLAGLVDEFDRQTHLNRMYDDGGLDRPEEILFRVTEKAASDFLGQHVQLTSGTIYEKESLAGLDRNSIEQWMGADFADAVADLVSGVDIEKLAAIVPTLPRPDAESFDRMAAEVGLPIFGRDKAAATSLSVAELATIAGDYSGR